LKKEHLRRLRLVLGRELNANNKIQAIGSLAVPVLRYSFGIVNWCQELQKLDRKTRTPLTIHGQHHTIADEEGLYVPRKQRKGPNAVRKSLHNRNYRTGGIFRQKGRSTNTDCQNTPTQHQLSSVTDS